MKSAGAPITIEVITKSARSTEALAARLARALTPPAVVLLDGDLGTGKTTFTRGFVRALPGGRAVTVQSPTFALARTYATMPPVHHLDLYRLDDAGALEALGLEELIEDGDAIALVEWARDLVRARDALHVAIAHAPDDTRRFTFTLPARFESLAKVLRRGRARSA